jgi:hypothetical protein
MELKINISANIITDEKIVKSTLQAQDGTCQFCGFQAEKFQEVLQIENEDTPKVACSFCAQTLNLFETAARRAGFLIYLPEMGQAELNNILKAIYVARSSDDAKISGQARKAFDEISSRKNQATEILGTNDPEKLAIIMKSFLNADQKKQFNEKLTGIRLLSLDKKIITEDGMEFNEFPQMLNYWKNSVDFLRKDPKEWIENLK